MIATEKHTTTNNPFPGLRAFKTDETHLFFGREGQVDEVLDKLEQNRFVATLGTSGSGKSSLMYCGLIPSLHGGFMTTAGSNWRVVVSRPGIAPIKNLAEALVKSDANYDSLDSEEQQVKEKFGQAVLKSSSLGLVELIKQLQLEPDENFLIMIDQFEELFRFNRIEDDHFSVNESSAFVKLMMNAIAEANLPIYVVMTMRSDYLGDCAQFPELTSMINDSHYLIPQMTRDQKRSAILGPVAVGGGEITPRLVQKLLNDLGDDMDQLPILQHSLMRTWDYWKNNQKSVEEQMDIFHYESIGKMAEALSMHANEAFEELNAREKLICADLFKSLTEKSNDGRGVRRPTQLAEIAAIAKAEPQEVINVIERFRMPGRTFLMPPPGVPLSEKSIIDISHESLMRVWVRCRNWVEEEFESVKIYKRLCEAAAMYQIGKTSLWRPPDLQLATNWQTKQKPNLVWAQRYDPAFERAMVFLETSKKTYEEEQRSKDRIQKRQIRIVKTVAIVIGVFCLAMIMLAIYANLQYSAAKENEEEARKQTALAEQNAKEARDALSEAEEQKRRAEQARVVADSLRVEAEEAALNAERALTVAKEQERIASNALEEVEEQRKKAVEASRKAQKAAEDARLSQKRAEEQEEEAKRQANLAEKLRYLSIAQTMAVKSQQIKDTTQRGLVARQAYIFNRRYDGNPYSPDVYNGLYNAEKALEGDDWNVMEGHDDAVRAIAYERNSNTLYTAGSDGSLYRWNSVEGNADPIKLGNPEEEEQRERLIYRSLAVSPLGSYIVAGTADNGLKVFDATTGKKVPGFESKDHTIWGLAYLPNNAGFVSISADSTVTYWDTHTKQSQVIDKPKSRMRAVSYTSDSKKLIGVLENGQVVAYDIDRNFAKSIIYEVENEVGSAIAISPDNQFVAIGFESGLVTLIGLETYALATNLEGHDARISELQYSQDGVFLASSSLDGTARVWHTSNLNEQPLLLQDHSSWVTSISFASNGEKLVTGTRQGSVRIYPLNLEEMADGICYNDRLERGQLTPDEWGKFVGKDIFREVTCSNKQ